MFELQGIVQRDFPKLDLPRISKTVWDGLGSNKFKVIETRKILAENYLQLLLQSEDVKANPDKILSFLGLPLHFYDLCEIKDRG